AFPSGVRCKRCAGRAIVNSSLMIKPKVLLLMHALSRTGAPKIALEAFEAANGQFNVRIAAGITGGFLSRSQRLAPTVLFERPFAETRLRRLLDRISAK